MAKHGARHVGRPVGGQLEPGLRQHRWDGELYLEKGIELTQEETENVNHPISMKELEVIIKKTFPQYKIQMVSLTNT